MTPFDQMLRPLTAAEVKSTLYTLLAKLGLPVTSWKEGAVVRTLLAVVATVFATFTDLMVIVAKSGFLDLAEGGWLTYLAAQVYGVERIEATAAAGTVTLTNNGGGSYTFDPGELVVVAPVAHKAYANTSTVTLGPGPGTTLDVAVIALEPGTSSNAAPGTITALGTAIPKVTVTNSSALAAVDEETDPALRQRCRDKLGALSPNGPKAAYAYVAKSATRADGSAIAANRVKVSPSGVPVAVVVAGPSGPIPGDPSDPSTDLGAIAHAIEQRVVPNGVTYTLASATAHPMAVAATIWVDQTAGLSSGDVGTEATARLEAFLLEQPIGGVDLGGGGGYVYRNALVAVIASAHTAVLKVDVTSPAVDEALGADEVAVLMGPPAWTVHFA
jgi:phage-related baseplate assembly protein